MNIALWMARMLKDFATPPGGWVPGRVCQDLADALTLGP